MSRVVIAGAVLVGVVAGVLVNQPVHAETPAAKPECVVLLQKAPIETRRGEDLLHLSEKDGAGVMSDWIAARQAEGYTTFTPTLTNNMMTVFCAY